MIGFVVGTLCLIALVKTVRRARYGYGYGGCGRGLHASHCGPMGGHYGSPWGGGEGGPGRPPYGDPRWADGGSLRFMLRPLFEQLQTSPGQERVILEAVETMQARGREVRDAVQSTGADSARAFRGERFDETAMGEAFARQDATLETVQKAWIDALMKVHEALDERQRRALADLMERGVGFFGRFRGAPYRF